MRLLALETSSPVAGLALYEAGAVTRADHFAAGMSLCQELPGRTLGLLECERLADAQMTALAVSLGPGSFTSLRVGLALAKAVAHCLELPLVGVPAPEVIAAGLDARGARIAVLQHSRADEMYVTLYEAMVTANGSRALESAPTDGSTPSTGGPVPPTDGPVGDSGRDVRHYAGWTFVAPLPEAIGRVRAFGAEVACGDAIARHREAFEEGLAGVVLAPEERQYPRAEVLARIAAERVAEADPQASFALTPTYVAPSQAERAAARKQPDAAQERG